MLSEARKSANPENCVRKASLIIFRTMQNIESVTLLMTRRFMFPVALAFDIWMAILS